MSKQHPALDIIGGYQVSRQLTLPRLTLQAFFTLFTGLLISFSAAWPIALVTLATFPSTCLPTSVQN